tara:strand:+ start:218 stop:322 length:105 start_codon:yes stop_codon:yes gene_type:complete
VVVRPEDGIFQAVEQPLEVLVVVVECVVQLDQEV